MSGETAVDGCVRSIRRRILAGEFPVGARLPPERTLATELGVNRTTLRAALGRLATSRLLTVRQGSAHVVQDFTRVAGLEVLPELVDLVDRERQLQIVGDLLAIRRRLAALVFERLAEGISDQALRSIEEAVEDFERVVAAGGSVSEVADADLVVTAALLAATGSYVLQLCFNPVSIVARELGLLRGQIYADPSSNVLAYRLLLAWLEVPSAEGIASLEAELVLRDERALERLREATVAG